MDSREREANARVRNHSSKLADDIDRIARRTANVEISEDTKIRQEIQLMIRKLAQEGKSKLGIMNRINLSFRGEAYKPYRPYFETWVDSALSVRARTRTKNKESEELER